MGLRRNKKNKIEFVCNVCDKVFNSRSSLYGHQYQKHSKTISTSAESIEEVMETTSVKDEYKSVGHLHKEVSHEKEHVVDI